VVGNRFSAAKLGWQPRWYNPDLPKWLHRIRVPAHVIWGAHDNLFPAAYAARWCELLPDARRLIVEEAGIRRTSSSAGRSRRQPWRSYASTTREVHLL